jgi:hypothetical protein
MKRLIISLMAVLFLGNAIKAQQPEWVASLSVDPEYYIGISSCEKSVQDYQSIVAKRALNLIAEQIQVTVTSSNELYTTEHNFNFNQQFIETIKTSSSITLQDYELYQAWEDTNTYFVYYRLSKQLYRDKLMLAYDNALNNSNLKVSDADGYLASGKTDEAIGSYLEASKFLEGVISNSFIQEKYNLVVNQWNAIQSKLLKILFDFQVRPVKEKFQVTESRLYSIPYEINAYYNGPEGKVNLQDIPVVFELSGNLNAFENKVVNSDNEGIAANHIINLYNELLAYTINCKVDFQAYLARKGDYQVLQSPEFSNLVANCKLLIEVIPVNVTINSTESTYSRKNSSPVIRNELGNYLRSQNIAVLDNEKKSDYIINLESDTRQGTIFNDMYSAYLDITYEVIKNSNDSLVASGSLNPAKGLSLNYETAASQAYKNVKEEIKTKLGKVILPYLK